MESYFFVPASKLYKLDKIEKLGVSQIIIDFEDSILSNERSNYLKQFTSVNEYQNYWLRIPVRQDFNKVLNLDFLSEAYSLGIRNIILPKLISLIELTNIVEKFKNCKFLILVEHPRLLLELQDFFIIYDDYSDYIYGLGLGSHDLMTQMGSNHEVQQLDYPRKKLLYIAKAYNIKAIDIASMNVSDKLDFIDEIEYSVKNGYDGKFLIHPKQFSWINELTKLSIYDVFWAQKVLSNIPKDYIDGDIKPFILDGKVIEKPHVLRALDIIKKNK